MKQVRVRYRDGRYWLEEHTNGHASAGLSATEISDKTWLMYQAHVTQDVLLQEILRNLDGFQYEQDHKERELK